MYVSKKKRSISLPMPDMESFTPAQVNSIPAESVLREQIVSETSREAPALELGRDLFLEPEDEPWENGIDSENEEPQGDSQDAVPDNDGMDDVTVPDDPQDLDDREGAENDLSYEEFLSENTDQGVLRVQASAGGQSIPLSNVRITVYRDLADGRHIFYTVTTDSDGIADGMVLPAPPRINSVEGNGSSPFASYSVAAQRDGLRSAVVENVPIFAGVKSIQPIILAPSESEV